MKKIGFSGTLDPITNGHMWVIEEARNLAEEVIVFISENPFKKCQFPASQRKSIVETSCVERGWNNVSVVIVRGDYTARAAKQHGVNYLLRGIRNTTDFDYENLLQQANVDVINGAKTMFVMPPRDLGSVSSSFIKGLQGPVGWHWHTKKFIPPAAYNAWIKNWLHHEWENLWREENTAAKHDAKQFENQHRWFEELMGAYSSSARHYHNLDHLVHGLSELNVYAANQALGNNEVKVLKLAFWFHDFIYGGNHDISDEEASARAFITSALDPEYTDEVASLIRATDHFQESQISHPLKHILLGADLAILGQQRDVYRAYAEAIREEYRQVPETIYLEKRRQALLHLDQKGKEGQLFIDPYFAQCYESSCNENLLWEIDYLSKKLAHVE